MPAGSSVRPFVRSFVRPAHWTRMMRSRARSPARTAARQLSANLASAAQGSCSLRSTTTVVVVVGNKILTPLVRLCCFCPPATPPSWINPKSGRFLAGTLDAARQIWPRAAGSGGKFQETKRRITQRKVSTGVHHGIGTCHGYGCAEHKLRKCPTSGSIKLTQLPLAAAATNRYRARR